MQCVWQIFVKQVLEKKEEIRYAFYELQTDGVTLFTRYGYGNYYLGHPDIRPIWEELHRRSAVVFIRPTHAVETNLVNKMLPQPFIDYPHEATRTAVDLIATDTIRKYSNCKVILSHAGDTLRYLAVRPAVAGNGCGLWKIPIFIVPTYILYTKSREYRTHQHPRSEAVRVTRLPRRPIGSHWLCLGLIRLFSNLSSSLGHSQRLLCSKVPASHQLRQATCISGSQDVFSKYETGL